MKHAFAEKKRRADRLPEGAAAQRKALYAQISSAAGRSSRSPDPAYMAGMQFRQTFDAVGAGNRLLQSGGEAHAHREGRREDSLPPERERELRRKHDSPVYRHSRRKLAQGGFCDRFASYAFSGGTLAGAVLAGRGEHMLVSCMERAAGSEKKQKLLGESAAEQRLAGTPARVVTNNEAHSAVGLVVESIRGATRTLDVIRSLAEGSGSSPDTPLEQRGVQTMRELYPFMRLREDDEFIARCKTRLKELDGDDSQKALSERQAVNAALTKAQAVREQKKAQQRVFLTKLAEMRANAARAEELFSSDGFAEYIAQRVSGEHMEDDPPDKRRQRAQAILGALEAAATVGEMIADAKQESDAADGEAAKTAEKDGGQTQGAS